MQARSKQKSIRRKGFFIDNDPLHTNYVPASRFRSCCDIAGMTLSDEEFRYCLTTFCDDEERHPGFVHYTLFNDKMDEVFTTKGFDTEPLMQPREWVPPTKKGLSTPLTAEEKEHVARAIARFHKHLINRRVFMKPHLQDYDRLNNGHITPAQFQCSCGTLGLQFSSEDEFKAVAEKFTDSLGFLYGSFVDACETGVVP
jgi:hypothetical protein